MPFTSEQLSAFLYCPISTHFPADLFQLFPHTLNRVLHICPGDNLYPSELSALPDESGIRFVKVIFTYCKYDMGQADVYFWKLTRRSIVPPNEEHYETIQLLETKVFQDLRAHAKRLAEALEKAEKKLCAYEVSMDFEYGQCRDLEEFEKDNLWGPEIIEARQALTLYRAENPKV